MDMVFSGIAAGISFIIVYIVLPFLKIHLGKKQIGFARDIITDIVASLEGESMTGTEKKKLAIAIAKKILKLKKINIPDIFISALIESSLYFLRKQFKEPVPKKEKGVIATYSVKKGSLN